MATTKTAAKATPAKPAVKAAAKTAPVKKVAQAPAPEPETVDDEFAVGRTVKFLGYGDDVPENERVLTAEEHYEIGEVGEADAEGNFSLSVVVANPDFDKKKKVSDKNPETILVDVFPEEVELVAADDEGGEDAEADAEAEAEAEAETEAPAAKTTKVKAAAPAAKTTTKVKAPAAKTTKVKDGKKVAAAEPAEEVDKYADLDEASEPADILELVGGAEDLNALAQELVEEQAAREYQLGGVLFHVRKTKSYESVDPAYAEKGGFEKFCNDVLGIEYRKAMYLVDIYYKFSKFGIDAAKVQELGWTKCAKVAAVMTAENAEDLVALASDSTVAELVENIKETYQTVGGAAASGGEKKRKVTFKFRLFEDSAAAVEQALQSAQASLGLKNLDQVFEHIIGEWAAEHVAGTPAKAPVKAAATKTVAKPVVKVGGKK